MNTYELRRCMLIISFNSHSEGASIYYLRGNQSHSVLLDKTTLLSELIAIGSLDEDSTEEEKEDYSISQWDALNIANVLKLHEIWRKR